MNINKALVMGNITKDIEIKALPSGMKVASFSVATNRKYTANGEKKEEVEFHNIVAFGKQAETLTQYCHKGDSLFVEGRIQTRSWEDKDEKKNYRTEIVLDNFQFGTKAKSEKVVEEKPSTMTSPSEDFPNGLDTDDIPF